MKMKSGMFILVLWFSYCFPQSVFSSMTDVTLENYLKEVEQHHQEIKSVKEDLGAKQKRHDQSDFAFRPFVFANAQRIDDQKPATTPSFQGFRTLHQSLQAGIGQRMLTGTTWKFSYLQSKTEIKGVQPATVSPSLFYDGSPQVEVTQDLWKNKWGKEYMAEESMLSLQHQMAILGLIWKWKQLRSQVEGVYWRYYFLDEIKKLEEESLQRAYRLRDWNKKRFYNHLVDESDWLQSEARVSQLEISHRGTLMEWKSARQAFEEMRSSSTVTIDEARPLILRPFREKKDLVSYISSLTLDGEMSQREDGQLAILQTQLEQQKTIRSQETLQPTLQFFGSLSLNGRNNRYSEAIGQSIETKNPYSVIGIRFQAPLDWEKLNRYQGSHDGELQAARLTNQRKILEIQNEWNDLCKRWIEQQERFKLVQKMLLLEKRKIEAERERYRLGRTTVFQVIQFEQDYSQTELLELKTAQELITLEQQLKLFRPMDKDFI